MSRGCRGHGRFLQFLGDTARNKKSMTGNQAFDNCGAPLKSIGVPDFALHRLEKTGLFRVALCSFLIGRTLKGHRSILLQYSLPPALRVAGTLKIEGSDTPLPPPQKKTTTQNGAEILYFDCCGCACNPTLRGYYPQVGSVEATTLQDFPVLPFRLEAN